MIIGIIPAAGKAERFGGLLKELLPWEGESLLRRTMRILQRTTDAIVVITRPEKILQHAQELQGVPNLYFVLQRGVTLLSAIQSVTIEADHYYFAMPDTVFPEDVFPVTPHPDFVMIGVFETLEGDRFGVWRDGRIEDKEPSNRGQPLQAWGVLSWPSSVMKILRETYLTDHTDALNLALEQTSNYRIHMDHYFDFATFEDYRACLISNPTSSITASES